MSRFSRVEPTSPLRSASRVAGIYAVLGGLWILFSDRAVDALIGDPSVALRVQSAKGIVFVALSALLIGALIFRELRARRTAERGYRTLVEQPLVGIYLIQDGRFVFVNRKMAEIFGYERKELVSGTPILELVAEEDRERVRENLDRRNRGEVDTLRYTFQGRRKDGSTLTAAVHGGRVQWDREPAVLGVLVDVTERLRLQEQLRQSQRLEEMGRLTGAVAHDFKNLLTAIGTSLELAEETLRYVEDEGSGVGRALDELREAEDVTGRASALIRQLLAFSRRHIQRPRPVDLNELIGELLPLLRRLTGPGVNLELDAAAALPPVEIDPGLFEQVLVNLVANADHACEGSGRVVVRTGRVTVPPWSAERPGVLLEVEDDGPGIPEEIRERIFEPFFTTREEGTGLGLATVHGIVEQADGRIDVTSRPGRGATFRIMLPASATAARPEAGAEAGQPSEKGAPTDAHDRGRRARPASRPTPRILVVEDEEAVLGVTTRVLERYGYRVVPATSMAEAEARAREHRGGLALILTDLGLPDGDGLTLADRLRAILDEVPVIFTSGHTDAEVMERLGSTPGARFLEKPFSLEELLARIRDALGEAEGGASASVSAPDA